MADHWRGTCLHTARESFSSFGLPLAKVLQRPFHPYSADAWALAVVVAEVRGGPLTRQATSIIPSSCGAGSASDHSQLLLDMETCTLDILSRLAVPKRLLCAHSEPPASRCTVLYEMSRQVCDASPALLSWSRLACTIHHTSQQLTSCDAALCRWWPTPWASASSCPSGPTTKSSPTGRSG